MLKSAYQQAELFGESALQKLRRLRTYVMPSGTSPAAREAAERWLATNLLSEAEARKRLDGLEKELISMGGKPHQLLADYLDEVEAIFPGARFLGVERPR